MTSLIVSGMLIMPLMAATDPVHSSQVGRATRLFRAQAPSLMQRSSAFRNTGYMAMAENK